ncbi:nuclease-related domain-containing protein [Geomonas azotofigens]|uniref:nuclease-related domain-containing protein n=1 Tax=Geomonas azotofigens TaxID=2843196 RepID=UPI001C1153FA|nr:nuclease-related domain-containing protein [Geomonas azotofigens]MBU5615413.1 NERD domain-containing protein [Geomonas azotofigens]
MVIKKCDSREGDVQELQRLLGCQISTKQRFLIEREMKCIGSGVRGEESSAYYIDFRYRDNENWAIIHDLRLELNGFVAQIDHLLINRFLDVYVLESKNYYYGIKISPEGEFLAWNGRSFVGIESPIEQNKRHIHLLEKVIAQRGLLPARLGITMPAAYHNYVLIAPNSRIDRPAPAQYDTSAVIKADALVEAIGKRVDAMGVINTLASAAKIVSAETLETFARTLARLHRPAKIDYGAKFGVAVQDSTPSAKEAPISTEAAKETKKVTCEACGVEVESKVVYFCRMNKAKFGGKILCQTCQRQPIQAEKAEVIELTETAEAESGHGSCEKCGTPVDKKVIRKLPLEIDT